MIDNRKINDRQKDRQVHTQIYIHKKAYICVKADNKKGQNEAEVDIFNARIK